MPRREHSRAANESQTEFDSDELDSAELEADHDAPSKPAAGSFENLGLNTALLRALEQAKFSTPTRIQSLAIPHAVEGRDILGLAQTGTGKTAAFALPLLQRIAAERQNEPSKRSVSRAPRALVLAPTRELAQQIAVASAPFARALHLRLTVVHGGVSLRPQITELQRGVELLIATPGRLEDLLSQRALRLDELRIIVLDEADRMLDEGFLPAVRRILSLAPRERQTMLFSATLPAAIGEIAKHAMRDPVRVEATPPNAPPPRIEQTVWFCEAPEKIERMAVMLDQPSVEKAIVFTRTKRGADRVSKKLAQMGLPAVAIHGDKSQGQRDRALQAFRTGKVNLLIATDIAARGIDVREVSHVINFELPHEPESYVHRIGRTARAGASGIAWAFCSREERPRLVDIEKLLRERLIRGNEDPNEQRGRDRGVVQPARKQQHQRGPRQAPKHRAASPAPREASEDRHPFAHVSAPANPRAPEGASALPPRPAGNRPASSAASAGPRPNSARGKEHRPARPERSPSAPRRRD